MASSGLAADSGLLNDRIASVNTALDNRVAVNKAQTLTSGQKTQGLNNLGAQAASAALTQVASVAIAANSGKVLSIDSTGAVVATTASAGGAAIDSTAPTAITN